MIRDLWLIGIGTGHPEHVTAAGLQAIRDAGAILLPHKGEGKEDLAHLREAIVAESGSHARLIPFAYPVRDPSLPYAERVARWHDEIARRWQSAVSVAGAAGPIALLVWGDPSLYDSTLRIAERLEPKPAIRVVPGITALQALTAAHAIPLNQINGAVTITTGRLLRASGWPEGAETVAVMLDGEMSFRGLMDRDLQIWWGAYLGMPEEVLIAGELRAVAEQIAQARATARARHGWLMDTYLLRRTRA
ncbi:MAG: precorrin-6A synthase (deacetylating) [Pseudomonadota bacterium]